MDEIVKEFLDWKNNSNKKNVFNFYPFCCSFGQNVCGYYIRIKHISDAIETSYIVTDINNANNYIVEYKSHYTNYNKADLT